MKSYEGIAKKVAKTEKRYSKPHKDHLSVYYWTLFLCILALMFSSLALFPVLLTLTSIWLYIILILMGLGFGLIFDHFIAHNKALKYHHHLNATGIIFVTAFCLVFIITMYANSVADIMQLKLPDKSAFEMAIIYACSFLIPYLFSSMMKKRS